MGRTTELRREIKRRFFPLGIAKGFSSDMRLRLPGKLASDAIFVCDIQWEKYVRALSSILGNVAALA